MELAGQPMRRIPMHMADWVKKLDAFLSLNEREIITHAGRISHEMAKELAEAEYEKFSQKRIREKDGMDSDFDRTVKQLTSASGRRRNEPVKKAGATEVTPRPRSKPWG